MDLPTATVENVALIRALVSCPTCSSAAGSPCADPLTGAESFSGVHRTRALRAVKERGRIDDLAAAVRGLVDGEPR